MATYHVNYNPAVGKIFAGTVNKKGDKWVNKTDVTEETLLAVREHLLDVMKHQEDNPDIVGYRWETTDNKTITLQIQIADKKE